VHAAIALEVVPLAAGGQQPKRFPRGEAEARVRGQGDRDVDVEDLLREPLIGVLRRDEEDEGDGERRERRSEGRENGERGLLRHARRVSLTP